MSDSTGGQTNPTITISPTLPAVGAPAMAPVAAPVTVHGPYEDLGIELLKTIQLMIATQPAEVQIQLWKDYLTFMQGVQTFASKLDFLHLFKPQT